MSRRTGRYDQDTVLGLVGLIYHASQDPEGWPSFLEALADTVGGSSSALGYVDPNGVQANIAQWVRFDPEALEVYNQHYFALDPFAKGLRDRALLRPGLVGVAGQLISPNDLRKTEIYNEFGKRYGYAGGMTAILGLQSSSFACVSVLTADASTSLEPADVALLQSLVPHLTRALQLHERLARLGRTAEVFDRLSLAMVLTDRRGKLVSMNQAAERVLELRDGLFISRGRLSAHRPAETRTLDELIVAAAGTTAGIGFADGGVVRLTRPSNKRPLLALVTPLWRPNQCGPAACEAGAAVFISDPESSPHASEDVLRRLYDLTPAEARITAMLVEGRSVSEISESLEITSNTVRTHLKRIFSKTDIASQSQLVRLILTGPAVVSMVPGIR